MQIPPLGACERWLADHGVPRLDLMVRVGNEPVLGFYDASATAVTRWS